MNYIGKQFGVYKVLNETSEKDKSGHIIYEVECTTCHRKFYIPIRNFNKGRIATTCKHKGIKYHKWSNQRLKLIFAMMKRRCYNTSSKDYKWYGGKGIQICEEWLYDPSLFEEWAFNNGYDDNLTIDRKDENKNYCPDNCAWIPLEENSAKKSTTNYITVYNETHSGREWSNILNRGVNFINTKIKKDGINSTIEYIRNNLEWENGKIKK